MTVRYLTGITPSGIPHLGNYAGAIRPSVRSQTQAGADHFYFLADLHSLIKSQNPQQTQRCTLEIAATWIACGLDPEQVTFYRQSDIPEIPQLTWLLTCVTGKGLLNRAHAYKAAVDKNTEAGAEPDADVTAGLFMYPVLMAADIMLFKAHKVPVGRDQVQHIEMARDMAASFNHIYGAGQTLLVPPEAVVDEQVATLPGLDGRKMSKSYGNTIPLFTPREQLRKLIMGIATDSRAPGQPKETEGSAIFQLYQAFASAGQTEAMRQAFAQGIAWGEAKQQLFELIDAEIAPMRAQFEALMADPARIEAILQRGAEKARAQAAPYLAELKRAVGLWDLRQPLAAAPEAAAPRAEAPPQIKQYREADGRFYFKLSNAKGEALLQSQGFDSGRDAGAAVARLKQEGEAALDALAGQLLPFARSDALVQALQALAAAHAEAKKA
ncbi:tryptophan--tRNA ligase [Allofranklinella schreckenbergeri]|uniref:Tryptophan--tRNA ligase n=1 Tax=Allofranklinella schreckenbergeri TaxID=1076744 RepID=A0A3M6PSD5_9BURK|nr:tryptophan--tRNA ligase [Allofranklinella schreckenbergeri]RMW93154.1 tryptophan--tRNA ligase [Allofranklinella schreckenbergeri]